MTLILPLIVVGTSTGIQYTRDGGVTYTAVGTVNSAVVPAREPITQILHGMSSGNLRNGATLLHTFPAAVSCIFVNPINDARILVGLTNGDVWRSIDAGVTWALLYSFGPRIVQLVESLDTLSIYTVVGQAVWVTTNDFTSQPSILAPFAGQATAVLISNFGNYAGSSDGTVMNTTTGALLGGPTSAILGLANNPRNGTLWVMEQNGIFWRKALTASILTNLSTLAGGGGMIVPVTPIPGMILAANTQGAFISPDAGLTWLRILPTIATSIGWYSPPVAGGF